MNMEKRRIPVFETEAEEAKWWYDHREELADDFVAAIREGRTGSGVVRRFQMREEAAAQAAKEKESDLSKAS
jgi:hypothetical protein